MKIEKWEVMANEYVSSLFPSYMIADAYAKELEKKFGVIADLAEKFEDHNTAYYYKPSSWGIMHQLFVKQIIKDPDLLKKVYREIKIKCERNVIFTKRIIKDKLSVLSNSALNQLYRKYCRLNQDAYNSGLLLPLLDFQKTTFLSDEVSSILRKKKSIQYFSLLTTPLLDTFNKKQELDLLKILAEITRSKKTLDLFKRHDYHDIYSKLSKVDRRIFNFIKSHTKKYAWVYYVYEGPAADAAYFIEIIKDKIDRNIDPKRELVRYVEEKKKLRGEQHRILKKIKSSVYERKIIINARDAVFYKMYRREMQTASYYYFEPVLVEIGRRLGLSIRQARMLYPTEIANGLIKGRLDLGIINQRLKFFVYNREKGGQKFLIGENAKNFMKNVKAEKVDKNLKIILGSTAQAGKARGVVKIVNSPDEMAKMNRGDILVSSATNPNLMPAIRKAAAIVTDEGGLTCHAAIVSREFKIPCVVGTGFITKIVKDGDRVEVDATKGIVRKIK